MKVKQNLKCITFKKKPSKLSFQIFIYYAENLLDFEVKRFNCHFVVSGGDIKFDTGEGSKNCQLSNHLPTPLFSRLMFYLKKMTRTPLLFP